MTDQRQHPLKIKGLDRWRVRRMAPQAHLLVVSGLEPKRSSQWFVTHHEVGMVVGSRPMATLALHSVSGRPRAGRMAAHASGVLSLSRGQRVPRSSVPGGQPIDVLRLMTHTAGRRADNPVVKVRGWRVPTRGLGGGNAQAQKSDEQRDAEGTSLGQNRQRGLHSMDVCATSPGPLVSSGSTGQGTTKRLCTS
ncbi:MAG: hypothetical protein ACI9WU_000200 [Myxococcota bacterium]|jgi:hypothetical protein